MEDLSTIDLNCESVDLSNQGIDALSRKLMDALLSFKNLRSLNLSDNKIRTLPPDLSGLTNLHTLSLTRNPIDDLDAVIDGLKSLPKLRHLHLDLDTNDEEELIVTLTHLESFNATSLTGMPEEDDEYEHPEASYPLSTLELSSPNTTDVQVVDAANTPESVEPPSQQRFDIANSRQDTSRNYTSSGFGITAPAISDEELKYIQELHEKAANIGNHSRDIAKNEFSQFSTRILETTTNILKGESDPVVFKSQLLSARRMLYDFCFDEIIRNSFRVDGGLSNLIQKMHAQYKALLGEYALTVKDVHQQHTFRMQSLQHDLDMAGKEISSLLESTEQLEQKLQRNENTRKKLQETFEQDRDQFVEEVGWLKADNEKLRNRLRQYELNRQKIASQIAISSPTASSAQSQPSSSTAPAAANNGASSSIHGSLMSQVASPILQMPPTGSGPNPPPMTPRRALAEATSTVRSTRTLTIRQLKDAIEDIYESKTRFDRKCADAKLPRETIEQHLYTYLNQKYGLKTLILDWASAIIQAVKKYSSIDNDVCVFGKILKNEIDEEFRFVQKQLRETVAELLRVYLKGRFPMKVDNDINTMLQKRMTGQVHEDEWVDIVKYMYNHEDSVNIIVKVREVIRNNLPAKKTARKQRDNQDDKLLSTISYSDFVNVLLDFQLKGHERFLNKFVKLFKQADEDRNGIINEMEFRKLLLGIASDRKEEQIEELINLIDPYNNQQITFSECVTFLSTELVRMVQDKLSV